MFSTRCLLIYCDKFNFHSNCLDFNYNASSAVGLRKDLKRLNLTSAYPKCKKVDTIIYPFLWFFQAALLWYVLFKDMHVHYLAEISALNDNTMPLKMSGTYSLNHFANWLGGPFRLVSF